MGSFCAIALLVALNGAQTTSVEITAKNLRASKLLSTLERYVGAGPSARMTADDSRGVISLLGTPDQIRSAEALVAEFDVPRRHVTLHVWIDSPQDKVAYEVSAVLLNMQPWKTSDAETGIGLQATPRVNEDGTVTVAVQVARDGREQQLVARLKEGHKFTAENVLAPGPLKGNGQGGPSFSVEVEQIR